MLSTFEGFGTHRKMETGLPKKHGELHFHIGAHKTATTHVQDTLNEIHSELLENTINFIPRHIVRPRLSQVDPDRIRSLKYRLLFGQLKRNVIKKTLFPDLPLDETIIISDENILGTIVDGLSTKPYEDLDRKLDFIRHLSKEFLIKIFFSIRSFDEVLPGAYITALRFYPKEAIIAKEKLLYDLENEIFPSWVDVIGRLKLALPKIGFKIWTQEDYRNHSNQIIFELLGTTVRRIPVIPPPKETITPSYAAIIEVEKMIQEFKYCPANWTSVCESIYASKPAKDDSQKYTFLNKTQIGQLRKSYKDDLIKISKLWPIDIIQF